MLIDRSEGPTSSTSMPSTLRMSSMQSKASWVSIIGTMSSCAFTASMYSR